MVQTAKAVADGNWIPDILVKKDNRVSKFVKAYDGRDKIIKLAIAVTDIANAIVEKTSGSPSKGGESVVKAFRGFRNVGGLINSVSGAAPDCVGFAKEALKIGKALAKDKKLEGNVKDKDGKDLHDKDGHVVTVDSQFPGRAGKALGLLGSVAGVGEKLAFITSFTVCTPCLFVDEHFSGSVSASVKEVGKKFSLTWMLYHIFGFIRNISDLLRNWLIAASATTDKATEACKKFWKEAEKLIPSIAEKMCDLSVDFMTYFKTGAPKEAILALNLASALIGITKMWHETR